MTVFLYANNANTTIAGPIAATATSINLAAGTGALFPTPGVGQQFVLTLVSQGNANITEITYCTTRVGDVCTVVRAREGTPATAFIAGDIAANDLTAGSTAAFSQGSQLQQQGGNYGVDTGTVNNIVVALNPAPASLALIAGTPIRILVKNTITGPTTLTLTPLSATTVITQDGSAMANGQIIANEIFEFTYNPGIGFNVSSPYVLLSRANTWTSIQTIANNVPLSWLNSGGTTAPVLRQSNNNSTILVGGAGTNPLVVTNSLGQTAAYTDTSNNVNISNTLNVASGVNVQGAGNFGGTVTIAPATVGGNAARLDQIGLTVFTTISLVTSSRALQTTYTNNTGKPMFVSVTAISTGPAGNLFIIVNGVTQYTFGQPGNASVTSVIGIVPATATYGVYFSVASFNLQAWTETY